VIAWILLGAGIVAMVEGLVIALAPSRLDTLLEMLARTPVEQRRLMGLIALAVGGVFVTIARMLGL